MKEFFEVMGEHIMYSIFYGSRFSLLAMCTSNVWTWSALTSVIINLVNLHVKLGVFFWYLLMDCSLLVLWSDYVLFFYYHQANDAQLSTMVAEQVTFQFIYFEYSLWPEWGATNTFCSSFNGSKEEGGWKYGPT